MEKDGGKGDGGTEEFTSEFNTWIICRHGVLGHAEGFLAEEIIPESGAGEGHLYEAGEGGEGEEVEGEALEIKPDETGADDGVEEEPEGGV